MAQLISIFPATWPWLILIAAQLTALSGRVSVGVSLLVLFASVASVTGLMSPVAIAAVALGLAVASVLPRLTGWGAVGGHVLLILWCVALGAHLLPGFNNLRILDEVQAGANSTAFTMYLNLDKPVVVFAVLLAFPGILTSTHKTNTPLLASALALLPLLFAAGVITGAVQLELGLPPWWLIFALSNLFLTCIAEEAFFRGYLQSLLSSKLGTAGGISAASLLFGLAHIGGGIPLVAFATLLGLSMGCAYAATGRLWVPIAMHFAFNVAHLAFFTYPAPA